jgi:hypothetical protein
VTLGEIIAVARSYADDSVAPYFGSDTEYTRYANRAEDEACERALLLEASLDVSLLVATSAYPLSRNSVAVQSARIGTANVTKARTLDVENSIATEAGTGRPTCFGQREQTLHVYTIPTAEETMVVRGYWYPAAAMSDLDADSPEIAEDHHQYLAHWIAYEAIMAETAEGSRPKHRTDAAEHQLSLFMRRFGMGRSAHELKWWREQPLQQRVRLPRVV